jgi:hypothetical protein
LGAVVGIAALGTALVLAGPQLGTALGALAGPPEQPEEAAADRAPVPAAAASSPESARADKPLPSARVNAGAPAPKTTLFPTVQRAAPAQGPLPAPPSPPADGAPTAAALKGRMDALAAQLRKAAQLEEDVDTAAMGHLDRMRTRLERDASPAERAAVGRGLDELERLYLVK